MKTKLFTALTAFIAAGSLTAGPASASVNDFFQCSHQPDWVQVNTFAPRVDVYLEVCYSDVRKRNMYRGNVKGDIVAKDALRVGYRDIPGRWVEHSYRSAPRDRVMGREGWEMPGEWYLAANGGWELTACVDLLDDARNRHCT